MAHFYASVSGSRDSIATKTGTKNSGMSAHVRGWNSGIRVEARHNEQTGQDEFTVYVTSGSNGHGSEQALGTFPA